MVEPCALCRTEPSTRKVAEEIDQSGRGPFDVRHELTARVCEACFVKLFGEFGVAFAADFDARFEKPARDAAKGGKADG